jgi:hypothetical protein
VRFDRRGDHAESVTGARCPPMLVAVSLEELLERQAGVAPPQAVACGLSPTPSGDAPGTAMDPLHPTVYLVGGPPAHRGGADWAASLYVRAAKHGVRSRRRVPARDAAAGAGGRGRDAAGRAAPPSLAGVCWHRHDLRPWIGSPQRALGDGAATDRTGDGTFPAHGSTFLDPALHRHVRFPPCNRPTAATWGAGAGRGRAS